MNDGNQYVSDTTCLSNYGTGWKLIFASFWPLLAVTLIYAALRAPVDLIDSLSNHVAGLPPWLFLVAVLYGVFVVGPITMGYAWVFLRAARREDFRITDLFSVFERNYWNAVGAGVLLFVTIVLGYLLLVVPGIILTCRLAFVGFLIVDRNMKVMESMRTSWAMTKGRGWSIFCMLVLALIVIIAGLIALFVGVFVSSMWIIAAFAVLYHSISLEEGVPG